MEVKCFEIAMVQGAHERVRAAEHVLTSSSTQQWFYLVLEAGEGLSQNYSLFFLSPPEPHSSFDEHSALLWGDEATSRAAL